jgi:hypothetical protein
MFSSFSLKVSLLSPIIFSSLYEIRRNIFYPLLGIKVKRSDSFYMRQLFFQDAHSIRQKKNVEFFLGYFAFSLLWSTHA